MKKLAIIGACAVLSACLPADRPQGISSFEECIEAGYPVMESYPEQCSDGTQTFTRDIGNELEKADLIRRTSPRPGDVLSFPLEITGEARGYWFFEATFPVELHNANGEIIAQTHATARGEWMTEDFVPFTATIESADIGVSQIGALILRRSNASGLPEHDDMLRIPVRFAPKFSSHDNNAINRASLKSTVLEQVPSEISISHFAKMRLVGTEFMLGDKLARNESYTRYSITYRSNDLLISGILNMPHGEGPFPLFVLNHGHIDRNVYTNGRGLKREQDYLARNGFAVLHPDYRGHAFSDSSPLPDDHAIYDAGLEYSMDVLNGIHAIAQSDLPIDTSRTAMLGHSMGGGVAMNIAVAYPQMIDAVVLYAPVHTDAWENFVRWRSKRKEGALTTETIGTRESDPAMWDRISSLAYLDRLSAPVLLFQGTNDADVPKKWSDFLASTLKESGKNIEYIVYEGERHEFIPSWSDFMERTAAFAHKAVST